MSIPVRRRDGRAWHARKGTRYVYVMSDVFHKTVPVVRTIR